MTEQPQPAGSLPPEYLEAAGQAVGQVQVDPSVTADESIEQIKAGAVRAALGEFEQQLAAQMAQAQAQFAAQQATIEALTRSLATVRAQAGPPDAQRLATAVAERIANIAIANPDLGGQHFAGVISQAAGLADTVKAIAEGSSADLAGAERTAHGIAAWFTRVHQRASGKTLEGMHVALDELERIVESLPELIPAAAAVTKAL